MLKPYFTVARCIWNVLFIATTVPVGDVCCQQRDYMLFQRSWVEHYSNSISVEKVRGLYLKALEIAGEDKEMVSIIGERLEDLGEE